MASLYNKDELLNCLNVSLRKELNEALDEVIEKAKKDLEEKLREELSGMALKLLRYYSVETRGENIVITVRNKWDL